MQLSEGRVNHAPNLGDSTISSCSPFMCLPVSRLFWVSSLAYPNLLGTKGYVVVVVVQFQVAQGYFPLLTNYLSASFHPESPGQLIPEETRKHLYPNKAVAAFAWTPSIVFNQLTLKILVLLLVGI
jgi:hypothetical protein